MRLDRCIRCEGVFVTVERIGEIIDRREVQDELRAMLPRGPVAMGEPRPMYVRCPVCATLMNRKQYATGAKVVIDVCRQHGVWFDGGELPQVLDFIAAGGLEEARRRDAERRADERRQAKLREALQRARQPVRAENEWGIWWLD